MDSMKSSIIMEEYELMKQAKYRVYMSNVDKALKNFEYSSEWADLISALGKLNKVISTYTQYQIIPRRIKISKRLAQCMHPALPSGVHLKALETYDVIFSNTGVERLATELFIYSAGLFPLLGYAAMNVRPTLLGIYEKYFVPLGERLRPALSGFLSGVLPGYESGLDHFERTNSLLGQVCATVSPIYFYTCLWECVATNASIRLPAVSYLIDHFNKKLGMFDQKYVMGKSHDVMMSGLCACLNDSVILVQRNTLEFLLLGFPLHTNLLTKLDLIKLVTHGLCTILRRDMSLNRRLYAWLLGSEVMNSKRNIQTDQVNTLNETYFNLHSKNVLIKALKCTLKTSLECTPIDLSPYRILVSLLDKVEIGPVVLDDVLCDVIRTMSLSSDNQDVGKSANMLFDTFDPAYIWNYMTQLYEKSCKTYNDPLSRLSLNLKNTNNDTKLIPEVDSGPPSLCEVCYLTEFLLETISLEIYNETTRVYLPKVFLAITQMLTIYSENLTHKDVNFSLKLCMKIVSRVQPMISYPAKVHEEQIFEITKIECDKSIVVIEGGNALEKSKSDSKINQTTMEDEPFKRSNSNQSMTKKSPKKTKKSKSYSKLLELDKDICSDTGQLLIPNAISTPNLEIFPNNNNNTKKFTKNKKSSSPFSKPKSSKNNNKNLNDTITTITNSNDINSLENDDDISLTSLEQKEQKSLILQNATTMQEYSILEKCIKQYEIFYQVYISQQVLNLGKLKKSSTILSQSPSPSPVCSVRVNLIVDQEVISDNNITTSTTCINDNIINDTNIERINDIDKLFDTLKINVNCRIKKLHSLLNKTISEKDLLFDDEIELNNKLIINTPSTSTSTLTIIDDVNNCNNINSNSSISSSSSSISNSFDVIQAENYVCKLMETKLNEQLRESVKLASNLLVEMSTFPNYNQNLIVDYSDSDIPCWLKVLSLVACYTKNDKDLQVSAISTLFELISLLKSQMEHKTNPGVTYVIMLPLLKFGHVNYLEKETRLFQVLTSTLWNYLGERSPDLQQISSLLYQLNNCLDSGIVETVIGHRIANTHNEWQLPLHENNIDNRKQQLSNDNTNNKQKYVQLDMTTNDNNLKPSFNQNRLNDYTAKRLYDVKIMCLPPTNTVVYCNEFLSESQFLGFKKFELLWHLGRDSQNSKGFERTLLKMFDKLSLPYHISIRIFITKFLQESFIRNDLPRLLRPLLKIILAPNTKKISVIHANSFKKLETIKQQQHESGAASDKGTEDDEEIILGKDIYAVRNDDGNVSYSYHIDTPSDKKRSPIRSLQKKFFGVTIGNKTNKTSNYISDKSVSISENNSNISLIINPLDNNSLEIEPELVSLSSSAPTQMINESETDNKTISFKEDFYSSCDESGDLDSSNDSDSTDKEITNTSSQVDDSGLKRFVGDCNEVSEILTEHDRTKNKKTYRVTKSSSQMIEKFGLGGEVTDGIITTLEESTPAEEYFNSSAILDIVIDNILNDLIIDAIDNIDDSDDNNLIKTSDNIKINKKIRRNKNVDKKTIRHSTGNITTTINNFKLNDSKRLSCTSKGSTDSNNSNLSDSKDKSSNFDQNTTTTTDSCSENECDNNNDILINDCIANVNVSKLIRNIEENNINNKQEDKNNVIINDKKINWERAKEKFDKVKRNVDILRQNSNNNSELQKHNNDIIYDKVHPFHTHMLLYLGVYDTKQVLYSFQTLRNIISCDCRTFLCLSVTTAISNNDIKQLLVRHKKSISGKGFNGTIINTEFNHAYRGCMYLEALVTICLYYARGYFQKDTNELNEMPTFNDIHGNYQIQMASIELLTLLCTELISIIKDMGKGLACYIADLMVKCKLQKIILHCIILSVHSLNKKSGMTFSEQILTFNDPGDERLYTESCQVQLLRLLLAVIKLEYEVTIQKLDDTIKGYTLIETNPSSHSPTRPNSSTPINVKYLPNCLISQQPMFLSAILQALQSDNLKHLHRNWTDLVTSSLCCLNFGSLTNIVISVVHQICTNIDKITKSGKNVMQPPDYAVSQLEALTVLCHYCLLDNTQQTSFSHIFNQAYPQTNSTIITTNPGQIFNNLVHVFLSTPISNENQTRNAQHMAARNAVLSHLPRIVASVAALWENEIGQSQNVKHQLLEFLSPVSLHHGVNFLTAISVAWQERGDQHKKTQDFQNFIVDRKNSLPNSTNVSNVQSNKALPQACVEQQILVKLVSGIRVMPMDSFVQTLHQVIKTPPPIHHPPIGLTLEVSALELFYFYMKSAPASQLSDCWSSLLALLRDGLNLSPPAQFVILSILNEFVQRSPQLPFIDKKDLRDLHDITSRLVEALSMVAGACLEQTTWLRRNLAVKEDISSQNLDGNIKDGSGQFNGNQQYSVQAQSVLAVVLANLLDVAYGSQEKDKVIGIVTNLMYNVVPYLKNHTARNIPSFYACSHLLASLSGYQYTRKAWRKDMLDLLLDSAFFQMDNSCLPFWKSILDSLMTYDNTTFRELMNRVSLAQTGLNIFTSREQEYEQRALLLKRLAFVIFCSELDQYHKYMPEIQEQLANSLRLPQVVPSVQAAVFLCFRVLLLRMSPDHVTSLWPIIIAEMVQVFLAIEQELMTDTEEYSNISSWVTNTNNGLHSHGHPHWRMVQLETAKLLELGCVLPATVLPHFQMYRWAFVGGQHDCFEMTTGPQINGGDDVHLDASGQQQQISVFVPHVTRIARLMDFRYTSHSPKPQTKKGKHLVLTCQSISNLQDLYSFFSSVGLSWSLHSGDNEKDVSNCLAEIEIILASDFLEKMPSNITTAR